MLPPKDDAFLRPRGKWGKWGHSPFPPVAEMGSVPISRRNRCVVCDRPLTVHQEVSGGTCARNYCRQQEIIRRGRELREKAEREQYARARAHYESLVAAPARPVPPDAFVVVLPANPVGVTRLPEERKAAIVNHVRDRALEAIEALRDPAAASPDPANPFAVYKVRNEDRTTLAAACGTCRGRCCLTGKEHAYITRATMKRFLENHPGADAERAAETYATYLPESSYESGCVFQGPAGCTLPRELRSDTCNTFLCPPLLALKGRRQEAGAKTVFAAAMIENDIRFSAWIDDGEARECAAPSGRLETDQTPTK